MSEPSSNQPTDENIQQAEGKTPKFEQFFRAMTKTGASDLHLKAGQVPYIRIRSTINPTKSEPLSAAEIDEMVDELMDKHQQAHFIEHGSMDIAYEVKGGDRFRLNIYRQRGKTAVAARRVTREIPDFESLHLPPTIGKIAEEHQGLVLISGPTGSGKSTTIASILEHINKTRRCHILTIEDPIEYIYEDKKAIISQREIGLDAESFEAALRALPREDPDVVLIGEMRDRETFQAALQVAETGHLVFGTVHASSASQTMGRIIELFPPDTRGAVRQSMAFNLQAILCQRLLPSIGQGIDRVPAVEVLRTNPSIRQLIEEGRDTELPDVIRAHQRDGMQNFTKSLLDLIEKDLVDPKIAYEIAPNPDELKMLMKGISSGGSGLLGR